MEISKKMWHNYSFEVSNQSRYDVYDPTPPVGVAIGYSVLICISSSLFIFLNAVHLKVLHEDVDIPSNSNLLYKYKVVLDIIIATSFTLFTPVMVKDHWYLREVFCRCCGSILSLAASFSYFVSGLLDFDRFLAVAAPFKYPLLVTKRKVHVVVLTNLFLGSAVMTVLLVVGGGGLVPENNAGICFISIVDPSLAILYITPVVMIIYMVLPPFLLLVMYVWLMSVTYRQARQISAQERAVQGGRKYPRNHGNRQSFAERIQLLRKGFRMTAITIGGSALSWGPVFILLNFELMDWPVPYWATMIALWCLLYGTVGAPITLATLKEKYRKYFKCTLSKWQLVVISKVPRCL